MRERTRAGAIGPGFDGGSVHGTRKSSGLAPSGQLDAGGRRYGLGGVANYDFSNGLLRRRFAPEGTGRDDKPLLVASSRMRQHVGRFDSWVSAAPDAPRCAVTAPAGLAEDCQACWQQTSGKVAYVNKACAKATSRRKLDARVVDTQRSAGLAEFDPDQTRTSVAP